ncbi:NADH-quinone oxidoreductase subunit D [Candidatus Comchoanobacter bicostacola]|uniref:NADH-quinone oxidoreductase subunit D n=1 Tax=Candidatus Comchoanobacter bicostacola TaxID=2919598 RepID=A0ABY5DKJ0_9GAMM|nr:NADH-quinone oxidoreductase subunit D [Candidatus Comchoanobacter bicostacola]UTC24786.1 NADH-quinone oxidoreductase subunit D [Candidatus Comchoanobacter bicostacola]
MAKEHSYTINFGPQHPAAHGVLRLLITLEGETVQSIDPHIGLLHRGTEKLMEHKTYLQSGGYFDRFCYVSMMANEHAYVMALEKMLAIKVPERAEYIRVLFAEITRLMNHLIWLGAYGLDLGAMSVFLYCFRDRDDLLAMYEAASGARMHANYFRVGGVWRDLPHTMPKYQSSSWKSKKKLADLNADRQGSLLDFIESFIERFPGRIDDYETLLTDNRIWKQRTQGVGVVSKERAMSLGFTGHMLRSTGVAWDLRKTQPYSVYDKLTFDVPVGVNGDCYDRYIIRIAEMRESVKIMKQCVDWLREHPGPILADAPKVVPPSRDHMKDNMEAMIHHFKLHTEGFSLPRGEVYSAVEHPKGEFGVYIVSDGANMPYRIKVRAAGFPHLAAISELCKGHLLADVVTILSSLDIVLGEVDR